jgi:hypothetical protein
MGSLNLKGNHFCLTAMVIIPLTMRDKHNRNLFQRATTRIARAEGAAPVSISTAQARCHA